MENNIVLKPKVIDLAESIKNGNSRLLKSLPKFAVKKLSKIIHEDELNAIHSKYYQQVGITYVDSLIKEFGLQIKLINQELVPKAGRYIYVANHPQGAIDAICFLQTIYKYHGNVLAPSNDVFKLIPNLSEFIVGINVFGGKSKDKLKAFNEAMETDKQIMLFPAGEVSRKNKKGIIEDNHWYKTFITKAVEYKRDIVPVFITGENSKRFYRTANIRKFFGIKAYIETMYLPDEMFKKFNSEITFIFNKPLSYTFFDKSKSHSDWALEVRKIVCSSKEKI